MDEALAIERITENENLTDGLNDEDANWLLQWGTSRAGGLVAGIEDDEAAGEKINQLMAVMRSLNAITADRATKDPASLGDDIQTLRDQYAATFGRVAPGGSTSDRAAITRLSRALPAMTAREALQRLLALLEAPGGATASAPIPASSPPPPPSPPSPPSPQLLPRSPQSPPRNDAQPTPSRWQTLRRRVISFVRDHRLTTLWLAALSAVVLIAVIGAILAGALRRQPSPGQVTTLPPAIAVYFTNPAAQAASGVDQRVVADLDQAKKTIDVASFDFNLPSVTQALARAQSRGVAVRVVLDEVNGAHTLRASDTPDKQAFDALQALTAAHIPVVDGGRSSGLMHNKFILIDGAILFVGSWNMSYNDTFRNNNNLLRITSNTLVANYQAKFDEMFVAHRFGAKATVGAMRPQLTVDGVPVENYFSPPDQVMSKLVGLVRGATRSVHFLAFTYTSAELADAMIAREKAGVEVKGVIETRGALQGALPTLFCTGVAVETDGNPYTMHDKVIILDDQTVITGSFNFTVSADKYNDENVVIFHNRALAALYEQEFTRIVAAAKQPANVDCAA